MDTSSAYPRAPRKLGVILVITLLGALAIPHALIAAPAGNAAPDVAALAAGDGENAWSAVAGRVPDAHNGRSASLELNAYKAFTLNRGVISGVLNAAPEERTIETRRDSDQALALPTPWGGFERFSIVESPIMADEMAAKHPDIKTYRGLSLDSGSTLRADLTPLGFHASVRGDNGHWYIDPYYHLDQSLYVSYFGRDLVNSHGPLVERDGLGGDLSVDRALYHPSDDVTLTGREFEPDATVSITISDPTGNAAERTLNATADADGAFTRTFIADPDGKLDFRVVDATDGVNDAQAGYQVISDDDPTEDPPTGTILRVYRLALITDPGYANFFGGPANVTPAKVTLMNRVNQLYEQDLSIRMQFVPNNDLLNLNTWQDATAPNGPCGISPCFTQAQVTGCSTLGRNRIVIGQIIGDTPYDIGHLALGQPGGGVANLGVVGQANKAGGCTGIPTPTGDFYAIDYVSHEMGHQFAGNHTFNGNQFNCSGGNRNAATSVEPASGSSIMAYAGICITDDLQAHSDPYFSQRSLQEISTYTQTAPTANLNEIQTASLSHFGGGDEVQTITFAPGFVQTSTIRPLTVGIGAVPTATAMGGAAKTGNVVTISTLSAGTTGAVHTMLVGDTFNVSGVGVAGYNGGPFTVSAVLSTRALQYIAADATPLATSGGGSMTLLQPGLSEVGNTVTVRTAAAHNRSAGQEVVISGAGVGDYNGTWAIDTIVDDRTFTYTNPTAGLANSGAGTVTYTTPFKLTIGGNDSANIGSGGLVYNNANLTAAINAIAGFPGTATVTGAGNAGFTITYTGASAGIDVSLIGITMLSCAPCPDAIPQETNHGGAFDSFKIRYNGVDTISFTNGTNYTAAAIDAALETLFGNTSSIAVVAFGATGTFDNRGFQVTFSNTLAGIDLPFLMEVVDTSPGMSGWFGETLAGGVNTRGGALNVDPSGNTFPTVTGAANKSIPRRTPFYLTGAATDAEQDDLWMWWEQNNIGGAAGTALLNNTKVNGPLFAMFPYSGDISPADALLSPSPGQNVIPANTPTRVFPDIGQIVDNNTNAETGTCPTDGYISAQVPFSVRECLAEFLPTSAYGASMTFRFTVRDGLGGTNAAAADTVLTLTATGPFLVTSPNTAVTWAGGSTQTVTWDVAGTDIPALAEDVRISLSTDGGFTYPTELLASTPNDGSADVVLPAINTDKARIKVEAVDNYFFDISNADFNIVTEDTATVVISDVNPSVYGDPVTFTATVTDGAETPTGTIQWEIDGSDVGSPVALDGNGEAEYQTNTLDFGDHDVVAYYTAGAGFSDSVSDTYVHTVIAKTATGVTSSVNPSVHGQGVQFTATVTSDTPGAGTPTGSVQFKINGSNFGAPVALNGSGVAVSGTTTTLTTASHNVQALFLGSTNYATSNGSLTQVVGKAATLTTVKANKEPSKFGKKFKLVAIVVSVAPGTGKPKGKVQFYIDGHKFKGLRKIKKKTGKAKIPVKIALTLGNHTIQARYQGKTNFLASNSTIKIHVVKKNPKLRGDEDESEQTLS